MVTELRTSPTPAIGVSHTCTHCGGRLFLDTDPNDWQHPVFMNCVNCARQVDMNGIDIRQAARVISPRMCPILGRHRRRVLVGTY